MITMVIINDESVNHFQISTMKAAAFIALFLIGKAVCEDKPTYTTKYDNIDLDEILSSERLLTGYVNCLLDQGPCTPDGKELKRKINTIN